MKKLLLALVLALVLSGCSSTDSNSNFDQLFATLLDATANKNYETIAEHIHPEYGLRLSPYGHVKTDTDQIISANAIADAATDDFTNNWGQFDGSGDPILMTTDEYWDRFVYKNDYLNVEDHTVPSVPYGGNILINHQEIYPDATIRHVNFPGTEAYDYIDWGTLFFVLKEIDSKWYLIGLINHEWTI